MTYLQAGCHSDVKSPKGTLDIPLLDYVSIPVSSLKLGGYTIPVVPVSAPRPVDTDVIFLTPVFTGRVFIARKAKAARISDHKTTRHL